MQNHRPELNYLDQYKELDLDNKPILILSNSSRLRSILSNALNYEQVIPNEDGLNRDYRGLAELLRLPFNEIRILERSPDPTLSILSYLNRLSSTSSFNNSSHNSINTETNRFCTIDRLVYALEKLDRFDVIDDLLHELRSNPIDESKIPEIALLKNQNDNSFQETKYDAYVSYVDSDLPFVERLCNFLESPEINLKLCLRDRDLLMGSMEYADFTELMDKRCNKLLVILSPEFFGSAVCEFETKFTFSLQIEDARRRLIPIIYKSCKLPPLLGCLTKINLSGGNAMSNWNLQKLVSSLSSNLDNKNQCLPITNSFSSLSIHTLNSSNCNSDLNSLSVKNAINNNHLVSSSQTTNGASDRQISNISENELKMNKSDKLNNSLKLEGKSSILNSPLSTKSLTTTQTFSTDDTHALIEKQKNFKFITKIWNKISISSSLNKK